MINKKYLNKNIIREKIIEFHNKKPIWYLVFDNFIKTEFYNKCLNEMRNNDIKILSTEEDKYRLNKTIFSKWENLYNLNNFFKSKRLEKYLWLFFQTNLEREFYINDKEIFDLNWEYKWLLWQLYEKWDYYDWHVDWVEKWISIWTFTYYLLGYENNDDSCKYWWELELWKWEWWNISWYKNIKPLNNRLVLLLYSENAFHKVNTILSDDFKRISVQATLIKKNENFRFIHNQNL